MSITRTTTQCWEDVTWFIGSTSCFIHPRPNRCTLEENQDTFETHDNSNIDGVFKRKHYQETLVLKILSSFWTYKSSLSIYII